MLISQNKPRRGQPATQFEQEGRSPAQQRRRLVMEAEMMRTLNAGVLAGCVCTVICVVWETARGRDASIKLHCPGHLSPFRAPRWETGSDTVSRGALLRA